LVGSVHQHGDVASLIGCIGRLDRVEEGWVLDLRRVKPLQQVEVEDGTEKETIEFGKEITLPAAADVEEL
jgi:hypothetical protein